MVAVVYPIRQLLLRAVVFSISLKMFKHSFLLPVVSDRRATNFDKMTVSTKILLPLPANSPFKGYVYRHLKRCTEIAHGHVHEISGFDRTSILPSERRGPNFYSKIACNQI